jgi:hypothetical protein
MKVTNPFANRDGSPKKNKLEQFWKWGIDKSEEKLASMPVTLRKQYEKALTRLNRRMKA